MWRRLGVRLRALLRRGRAEAELDEELRYHLERETERHVARGLGPEEARRAAERAFGNVAWLKDGMRDAWGLGWWEALRQDVRFSLRSFRRSPVFAVTVVATIALALGLNTAAFTLFDAYVLRPLRVRAPYSLYEFIRADRRGRYHRFSCEQYEEVRRLPASTESFAYRPVFARLEGRPTFGAAVSGDYFRVLGGTPALGRLLLPGDAERRSAAVMVLGYDAWRTRFGADSSLVGRRVLVHGVPVTVVGVTARDFDGLATLTPDFWLPLPLADALDGGANPHDLSAPGTALRIVLRLPHGMEHGVAVGILSAWAAAESATDPDTSRASAVQLPSVASVLPRTWSTFEAFLPLLAAFALILLIACANVANMMLARGLARQREIGIRLSLGAGRRRLIRQLLTEAAVLSFPAAALDRPARPTGLPGRGRRGARRLRALRVGALPPCRQSRSDGGTARGVTAPPPSTPWRGEGNGAGEGAGGNQVLYARRASAATAPMASPLLIRRTPLVRSRKPPTARCTNIRPCRHWKCHFGRSGF